MMRGRPFRHRPLRRLFDGALFQYGDGWQGLAFEEFQEGAAAGRDVADIFGDVELGDGGQRIAATGDREGLGVGDGGSQHLGAAGELRQFEDADRAVPDDGAGVGDDLGQLGGGFRADVENAVMAGDIVDRDLVGAGQGGDFVGDDDVGRHRVPS